MAAEHILNYTGEDLDSLLAKVETLAGQLEISNDDNGKILRVVNGE